MTILKLRAKESGEDRVTVAVFAGRENRTLQLAGTLHLYVGEYQLLGSALKLGAVQQMGQLKVVCEGYLGDAAEER